VPDAAHQALVMEAIYGERGVKAGHTAGACRDALVAALGHLAARGATVAILGCTELPLVLPAAEAMAVGGRTLAVLDPTEILARACVAQADAAGRN
jgi:aspartate racemase